MKVKILVISIFFICLYLIGGTIICDHNSQPIKTDINKIFFDATISELTHRIESSGVPIFWGTEVGETDRDSIIIEQENQTMAISKTEEYENLDRNTKIRNGIQTALYLIGLPLQTSVLDSLFQSRVYQIYPKVKTAIQYKDQVMDHIIESQINPEVYNKFHTDTIHLGLDKEMYVLGFYTLPFSQIIMSSKTEHLFFTLCWSITFFLSVFLIYYRNKKIQTSYIFVKEAEEKETSLISLSQTLFYDPVKQEIRYHSKKIIPLRGNAQKLFPTFLNAPDYFLTNEQIDLSVWGHSVPNNTRLQAIKRLRDNLNSIPEFQIENYQGRGYQLQITEK